MKENEGKQCAERAVSTMRSVLVAGRYRSRCAERETPLVQFRYDSCITSFIIM